MAHTSPVSSSLTSSRARSSAPEGATAPPGRDSAATLQLKAAVRGADGLAAQEAMLSPASAGGGGGASGRLPAPVQAKMERAFGADFSGVRVHQGGEAGAIGAKAFARGDDLHFAPGAYDPASTAGQELLGHELAHVVQQRAGRVAPTFQAKGGLGVNTDPGLEAEADALGARAARGEVVGGGGGAGRASGPGVVQGLFVVSPEQALAAFGHDFGGVAMRVSDDGTLAAPAGEDVKHCYATKDQLKASNKVLETNRSQFRLSAEGGADVTVRSAKNKAVNLHKVVGTAPSRNERGDDLTGGPNCNQMGQAVMGKGKVKDKKEAVRQVKGTGMTLTEASSTGLDMMRYTNELAGGSSRKSAEKTVTRHNARRESTPQVEKKEPTRAFRMPYAADVQNVKTRVGDVLMRWAGENRNTGIYKLEGDHATATVRDDAAGAFADQIRHIEDDMKRDRPRCLASIDDVGAGAPTFFGEYDTTAQEDEDRDAIDTYDNLDPVAKEKAQKKAGLDVYAAPEVGEAFSIAAVAYPGRDEDVPFPYHWAGVVAKAGADTVTLENYAGRDASGVYFTMYGPQTKVTVGEGSVTKADDQGTKEDKESTTFHGQWKETFPGVHTVTHAAKMVEKK